MVTHRLQVERRTGKSAGEKTDVLPLFHATNKPKMFNSSSVVTSFDAGRLAAERHHLEVEAVLQPQLVHNADDLQR